MSDKDNGLAEFVAQRLEGMAGELVEEWIEWIQERSPSPVIQTLPHRALRNHIPPVLLSLAEYMRSPTYALRQAMLGHLRLHGQIRRDQGYDLRDLLAEFDALAQHVQSSLHEAVVDGSDDWSMDEVLRVFGRLSTGLRSLVFVASATYRETESSRAQTLSKQLSQFGRTVAHEIRSPLQAILMASSALQLEDQSDDPEAFAAQVAVVQASVRRISGLLDNVHVLAAAETARGGRRMQDLEQTLSIVRQEMSPLAQSQSVAIEFPETLDAVAVEGVVAQLVLINLISNGIKYSDPDKNQRWVRVAFELEDDVESPFIRIEVSDNGLGIPEEFQGNVFQRSFRAHPEVSEGSGLGLAICQALVTERGGVIEMESEEGQGSLFRFTLRAIDSQILSGEYREADPEALMLHSVENLLTSEKNGDLGNPDSETG